MLLMNSETLFNNRGEIKLQKKSKIFEAKNPLHSLLLPPLHLIQFRTLRFLQHKSCPSSPFLAGLPISKSNSLLLHWNVKNGNKKDFDPVRGQISLSFGYFLFLTNFLFISVEHLLDPHVVIAL